MNYERVNKIRMKLGLEPVVPSNAKQTTPILRPKETPLNIINPGDAFAYVIFKITGQRTAGCGKCGARKRQMNMWGWLGCLKNRRVIIKWITEEAQARGYKATPKQIISLLKTAKLTPIP